MRSVNAEALPTLEPLELERRESALRRRGLGSWVRGALVLDLVLLAVAATMSQLEAARVGIVGVPAPWLVVYGGLAVLLLRLRGMYSWQLRLSMLESARTVLAATVLAAMTVVSLRILLPGNVDNLAPQMVRLFAFSAVYLTAGRIALDWAHLKARRLREAARPTLIVGAGRVGSPGGAPAARAPGARPRAGRLRRQGAARRGGRCRCRCSGRAGISRRLIAAARHRARGRHLLDRAVARSSYGRSSAARSSASRSRSFRACSRASAGG